MQEIYKIIGLTILLISILLVKSKEYERERRKK